MTVDDLEKNGYQLKEKFLYSELADFIKRYLGKTNAATVGFLAMNVGVIMLLTFQVILVLKTETKPALSIPSFLAGFGTLLILIPVHEFIHAIAYKAAGAKYVSFDVNFKQFIFLTVADKFVANKSQFIKILLAPCVVISASLILAYLIGNMPVKCAATTALFLHTLMCSGDFGLTSYFLDPQHENVVTYDDNAEKTSYFFEPQPKS